MAALQRELFDAGIEVLRLDRPQARNALDSAALAELEAALAELAADPQLRVLGISTTSTRALCAGADVAGGLEAAGRSAAAGACDLDDEHARAVRRRRRGGGPRSRRRHRAHGGLRARL